MLWGMGQTLRWVALWMLYCAGIGPRLIKSLRILLALIV